MQSLPIKALARNKLNSWGRFLLWIKLLLFIYSPSAWSVADAGDLLQPIVSESLTYDDNLYRISGDRQLGPQMETGDFINNASAGGRIHKALGRQIFDLDLQVDDNRYAANTQLDNVSTKDSAVWRWQVGHGWSGKLGADYSRSLAGFANTQFFALDLLDRPEYYFDVRYQLNSNLRFDAGWRKSDTTHSAATRQNQNIEAQTSHGGVTFLTSHGNSLGVEYAHTDARFPLRQLSFGVGGVDIAYQENLARALFKYDYSPKLHFDGQVGYLIRSHPNLPQTDYQGAIWRIGMNWMPTAKTLVAVATWHELAAFAELASNYYISEGVSLTPSWNVSNKIVLSGQARIETQNHSGVRKDELFSSQVSVSYTPVNYAELNLAYQFYQRDSNRQFYSYVGDSITATVRLKF
ncbi:outer membrane beta-barrel protein [Methylobacter sp.]|uniref:outer membrane beta-barrel protein n=1 Tax=Methylobacter sp. TaxID=2051955 RepID=UPI002FDE03B6